MTEETSRTTTAAPLAPPRKAITVWLALSDIQRLRDIWQALQAASAEPVTQGDAVGVLIAEYTERHARRRTVKEQGPYPPKEVA